MPASRKLDEISSVRCSHLFFSPVLQTQLYLRFSYRACLCSPQELCWHFDPDIFFNILHTTPHEANIFQFCSLRRGWCTNNCCTPQATFFLLCICTIVPGWVGTRDVSPGLAEDTLTGTHIKSSAMLFSVRSEPFTRTPVTRKCFLWSPLLIFFWGRIERTTMAYAISNEPVVSPQLRSPARDNLS